MAMLKVTGLDKLGRDLDEAQKAVAAVDGHLGEVGFDPNDPESIEAAIQSMEELVDDRLAGYAGNPFVGPMISPLKERYRSAIVETAAEARRAGDRSE